MIDALDASLALSLALWETGKTRPLTLRELEVGPWFELSAAEKRALKLRPRGADSEWLEVCVAGLIEGMLEETGPEWAMESARHIAELILEREDNVCVNAARWGEGTPVEGNLKEVLTENFPTVSGLRIF